MITIQEYDEAKNQLKIISEKEKKEWKLLGDDEKKIRDKIWELEKKIRDKKYQAEKEIDIKKEKLKNQISNEEEPHQRKVAEFKRILEYIDIIQDKDKTLDFEVYDYGYPKDEKGEVKRVLKEGCWCYPEREKIFYPELSTIKDDEYARIKAFIVENRKPKNKFSLIVVGKSIFPEFIVQREREYGIHANTTNDNIRLSLKDAPTKEELVLYFGKHKSTILKDFLNEHEKAEQEYRDVADIITKNKDYILAYWEYNKDYFENSVSRGSESETYKQVLIEIEKLKGE